MWVLADAATPPAAAIPTAMAALVTSIAVPAASIVVALIYRKGDKRTEKADTMPDLVHVLQDHVKDLDARIQALVVDRDQWRLMAWRAMDKSETETREAFEHEPENDGTDPPTV